MKEQIQNHIETLFESAPKTRSAYELREELLANSIERYNDLISENMPPEEAYQAVIHSIGNVNELFTSLETPIMETVDEQRRKKSALITAIAVGLYILAGACLMGGGIIFGVSDELAAAVTVLMCIVPTCMLVYKSIAYPSYHKRDDSVVESFKEWNHNDHKNKSVRGAVSTIIWMACLVLYFVISFETGAWHVTWILFLVAVCAEAVATLVFHLRERQ